MAQKVNIHFYLMTKNVSSNYRIPSIGTVRRWTYLIKVKNSTFL